MALMTLEFKLNGGKMIFLTYQEAELLYKDLEKIFGKPAVSYAPPLMYSSTYREHPRDWTEDQKEAIARVKLNGEAH